MLATMLARTLTDTPLGAESGLGDLCFSLKLEKAHGLLTAHGLMSISRWYRGLLLR